ncbi:M56 family metallopeptidase [Maribacter halichondriae]|uniref:M56 family metallopeptidase n=1 Tax=Maribacter halichondriae TaxID=2980554 RepID=UPI002359C0CE|nr:M56 family metallopeptidase [Maribacter sp. Hal144]
MLLYILKFSACLGILLLFYTFFLEREKMHVFKRFYLLGALVFSLIVPQLVFTEYVVVEPTTETVVQPMTPSTDVIEIPPALETDLLDVAPLLWGLYFLGLIFFGLNFIKNLIQVYRRIKTNPKERKVPFVRVLLRENFPPHTFFNYIFLNKVKLESKEIPEAVLLHEETHAKQKHSLDVLFIELLQVVMWFNPLVYFARKSIKLNHEFLADSAVLEKGTDSSTYQNTLLSFMTPSYKNTLANAINYSSIKKRFTVMKKRTSKKAILLRSLLLLPLLAIMLYGFSQRNIDYTTSDNTKNLIVKDFIVKINEGGTLFYEDNPITLKDISLKGKHAYSGMTRGEKNTFVTAYIFYDENQIDLISEVEYHLKRAGIRNIQHVSQQTAAAVNEGKIEPSKYNGKTLEEARGIKRESLSTKTALWFDIKNEDEIWFDNKHIAIEDLAEVITQNFDSKNGTIELQINFYSTGILRSEFVAQLNIESRKAGAKKVEVVTEEYIIPRDEFVENGVKITPNTVKLKTERLTLEGNRPNILVDINGQGQLLVNHDLMDIIKLKNYVSKLRDQTSEEEKESFKSVIYIQFESPSSIIDEVYKILTGFGDVSILPIEKETFRNFNVQEKATSEQIREFDVLAKKYNAIPLEKRIIPSDDLKTLEVLYRKMTDMQRASAHPFPKYELKTEIIQIEIDKKGAIRYAGNLVTIQSLPGLLKKYNPELSKEEREKSVRAIIKVDENAPKPIVDQVEQIVAAYGVAQIDIRGQSLRRQPKKAPLENKWPNTTNWQKNITRWIATT